METSDFDAGRHAGVDPVEHWERRYTAAEHVWSGRVNRVLEDVVSSIPPGRALDLGCGEGADVIWLASRGWSATGVDLSPTAIARATESARLAGQSRARFIAADLADVALPEKFDLVSASFLHSTVELPRTRILRRAAQRVARGGYLLITSHTDHPSTADEQHGHAPLFLAPEEEVAELGLDAREWDVMVAETRSRDAVTPSGGAATRNDGVVLVKRR